MPQGGVSPPLLHTSRGVAVGDVDGDGGLDLLVVNRDGPAYLLMNRASGRGNWIRFRVQLAGAPRDAHGATVSGLVGETRVYRDVQPDGSYLTSSEPLVHFGLGAETRIRDVEVRWPGRPSSETEGFGDVRGWTDRLFAPRPGCVGVPLTGAWTISYAVFSQNPADFQTSPIWRTPAGVHPRG